ncbi:protein kinase domain-containing protein [Thermoactinospora rubra]|uniref:protein kinase domain-containing protein n=1 Tax=Thermoactinospora rubra TaxID=1088767 RepID=UPI000A11DF1B|nr:protein kinase [Thermoactinospora rubra]
MKLAGRYRLLNPLGEGAVRLAFDEELHRDVVVKELRVPADQLQSAVRDARTAATVRHPCLVTVFDVLDDGWLVMEFVSGCSLDRAVASRHPLPLVQAARAGVQVLEALSAVHAAGLVHGRVNPGNVMLTTTGRAVLMGLCGPRPALPPSADLWSLAASLHFAVEGRPPGHEPAPAADPLRALIRDLLDGRVPVEVAREALAGLASGRPAAPAVPPPAPPPPPAVPQPMAGPQPSAEEGRSGLRRIFGRKRATAPEPAPAPQPIQQPHPVQQPQPAPAPAQSVQQPTPEPQPMPEPQSAPVPAPGPVPAPPSAQQPAPQPLPPAELRLDARVAAQGPLPPREVAALGLCLLDELVALHQRGAHHGDVRPGTVVLHPGGRASLAPRTPITGLSPFTAPEGNLGPASDLWSLGATLYMAVEGRPPAPGAPLAHADALAPVLFRLLSGDPAQRPAPDALREELKAVAEA